MKNWQILALLVLALSSIGLMVQQEKSSQSALFQQWKSEFGFQFSPSEQSYRRMLFLKNLQEIKAHNSNPSVSYTKGVNQFSHLSDSEFAERFLSSIYRRQNHIPSRNVETIINEGPLMQIDWQALGKVSPVKNQGNCDAGYAFCSASLIESFYLLDNKNTLLSQQQIVDCSASYTTFGCNSGSRNGTLTYIREKGLTAQSAYPYTGVKSNCKKQQGGEFKPAYTQIEFSGCSNIQNGLYASPLTVAVNAQDWRSYKAGIYNGCTSIEVNHDILLIGLTSDFWRLKNSWGQNWGEYGFIRLKAGNTCGICQKPAFGFKK